MVKETQRLPQRVVGESQNQCFFASQYVSECGVCGEKDLGYNSSGQSSMSSCRCENTQNSQQESNVVKFIGITVEPHLFVPPLSGVFTYPDTCL